MRTTWPLGPACHTPVINSVTLDVSLDHRVRSAWPVPPAHGCWQHLSRIRAGFELEWLAFVSGQLMRAVMGPGSRCAWQNHTSPLGKCCPPQTPAGPAALRHEHIAPDYNWALAWPCDHFVHCIIAITGQQWLGLHNTYSQVQFYQA
jgi:hypothetical protein